MEEMNREADEILDQDVESTRRMRNLVHHDIDVATRTNEMLDEQGRTLSPPCPFCFMSGLCTRACA